MLVGARFVQGVGAAMQASVILAIIVTEFPEPGDRARAMSAYVFTAVSGGTVGLLAGGVLTQLLNWHWIFFVNLPIGIGTVIAGRALIPNDKGLGLGQGIDWLGSILVTISIGSAVYAIIEATNDGWGSSSVILPAIVAVALMACFLMLESRIENPIMPLRIFRLRGLMGASVARGFLVTGMYGVWFLGSLYLERVLGYGPVETGLAFMPWTLTVLFLSLGTTRKLVARFGAMPVMIAGMLSVAVGMMVLRTGGLHRKRVYADADDRNGRCAAPGCGPRLRRRQRLAAGRGRARSGVALNLRHQPHPRTGRRPCWARRRAGGRLPPRIPAGRGQRSRGRGDRVRSVAHAAGRCRHRSRYGRRG
jgi:MFS family permease